MKSKKMTFKELDNLSEKVSKYLENGGCIGLIGDLGVGKTTFTKKICDYYRVKENVKSPTFTYVIEYVSGDKKIYHFDAYRIKNSEEIYEIGFEDYIGQEDAIIIVEWANNILEEMPYDTLYIDIEYDSENTRKVSIYKLNYGEKEYVNIFNDNNN